MTKASLLRVEEGLPRGVRGAADPRFSNVVRIFAGLFPGRRFGGGALSVYIEGRPVVDVWMGWSDRSGEQAWTADTGAMVFSATKGMAAAVIHRLVDRGLLSYDEPVAQYWPEFGASGKDDDHGARRASAPSRAVASQGSDQGRTTRSRADGAAPRRRTRRPPEGLAGLPRADVWMDTVRARQGCDGDGHA